MTCVTLSSLNSIPPGEAVGIHEIIAKTGADTQDGESIYGPELPSVSEIVSRGLDTSVLVTVPRPIMDDEYCVMVEAQMAGSASEVRHLLAKLSPRPTLKRVRIEV